MRVKTLYFICSEVAIQSIETRQTSIINIVESLESVSIPLLIQKISLSGSFVREASGVPDSIEAILIIKNNADVIFEHKVTLDFKGNIKLNNIFNLNGLIVKAPGSIKFALTNSEFELDAEYSIGFSITGNPSVS